MNIYLFHTNFIFKCSTNCLLVFYVNGEAYESGTASTGTKVDAKVSSSGSEGMDKPDGEQPQGDKPDGEPPQGGKPDGDGQHGDKPDGEP